MQQTHTPLQATSKLVSAYVANDSVPVKGRIARALAIGLERKLRLAGKILPTFESQYLPAMQRR